MEKTIDIEGMTCGHCSARVEKALNSIHGIKADVVLEEKKAYLTLAEDIPDSVLIHAVEDAGYTVQNIQYGV